MRRRPGRVPVEQSKTTSSGFSLVDGPSWGSVAQMSDSRARAESLNVDTSTDGAAQPLPPIAAAFLVNFDIRKGYTIAWQRSIPEVDIEGVVEYKSLPSGLHNIKEDLVYFIHNDYAGISAFINEPAPESQRNASMLSIGVLVPLDSGRMGKIWRHAEALKSLARAVASEVEPSLPIIENVAHLSRQQIRDIHDTERLEDYWEKHRLRDGETSREPQAESPLSYKASFINTQPNGDRLSRVVTDAAALTATPGLSAYHPALSLTDFTKSFGPLIFRLYRAALLRKRILLVGEAPVHQNCDFVYDLSIVSSVPKSLSSLLPIDGTPAFRLRPLFNVGVYDIPQLSETRSDSDLDSAIYSGRSWIACTTDDVLATKPELFDVLVVLPPAYAENATRKVYPMLVESSPSLSRSFPSIGLKATQRDARRYQTLRAGLRSTRSSKPDSDAEAMTDDDNANSIISEASSTLSQTSVVEPMSWTLAAYTSLMWWASAGEKRSGINEEEEAEQEQDRSLLMTENYLMEAVTPGHSDRDLPQEIALVSYFQRLTSLIFTTVSDAISRQDGEEVRRDDTMERNGYRDTEEDETAVEEDVDQVAVDDTYEQPLVEGGDGQIEPVEISQEDMTAMGLDIWSAADRTFVEELVQLWWGRTALVKGGHVECCGVRLL